MKRGLRRALAALLVATACTPALAALSDVEQRIVAAVKERSGEALQLLQRAVEVSSGTLNTGGVREVGRIFGAELEALGFQVRWADMPPEMKRAGHLVATREGSIGRRVLLLGHLDTVFEKQSPTQGWERRGERVRGPGVNDMKGGDVVLIEALRALAKAGALDDTTIRVVLTGDEERTGRPLGISRAPMIEAAKSSDVALSFEATGRNSSGNDFAMTARRASGGFTLTVTAVPGHSARMFSERAGLGAIYEGARILNAFRERVAEPGLSFSPGVVLGGTTVEHDPANATGSAFGKGNVIPRSFIALSDMRYLDARQAERARAKMRAIVAENLPGTRAEIAFSEAYPPMAETEGNTRLLALYSDASRDAGFGPVERGDPEGRGAGDVQFVAPYVDTIDGLGVHGTGAHTSAEDLEIASVERGAIRAAILIYRLTRGPRPGNAPR